MSSLPLKGNIEETIDFGINAAWGLIPARPFTSYQAFDLLEGHGPNSVQRRVNTTSEDLGTMPKMSSENSSFYS